MYAANFLKTIVSYDYTQAGTYTWQTIIENAKTAGYLDQGVYDVVVRSNNGVWWVGWRATFAVSGGTNNAVTNVYNVKPYTGGCSPNPLPAADTTGFTYAADNCYESISIVATRVSGY